MVIMPDYADHRPFNPQPMLAAPPCRRGSWHKVDSQSNSARSCIVLLHSLAPYCSLSLSLSVSLSLALSLSRSLDRSLSLMLLVFNKLLHAAKIRVGLGSKALPRRERVPRADQRRNSLVPVRFSAKLHTPTEGPNIHV